MKRELKNLSGDVFGKIFPSGTNRREVTELHVHLGGSVPLYRLWEMGIARGIRGVGHNYEAFIQLFHRNTEQTGDLDRYLEVFDIVELIQAGPDAVAECIRIAINGAYRTGGMRKLGPGGEGGDPNPVFAVTQLELRFNPMKRSGVLFTRGAIQGLFDVDRIIRAACESAEESSIAYRGAIKTGLLFCFGRDLSYEVNRTLAEKVQNWRKVYKNIVGVDLAGPESATSLENPADLERMGELYDIAAGDELGRTVHCGETTAINVETFINTLKVLKPHRVGHPITAIRAFFEQKDARALELLAEKKITVELCVHSNVLTRAVPSAEYYGRMLGTFDQFGIPYTFSTDSPALQLTTLASELDFLVESGAASPEQILRAFENADKATFLARPRQASR